MSNLKPGILIIVLLFQTCLTLAQEETINLADSLSAVGKQKEAIRLLEDIHPKTDKVYLKLAKNQRAEGLTDEALESYTKVLAKNPHRILTAIDYGELLIEAGRLNKADSLFNDLIVKYPDNANFRYRMGLIKEKQHDKMAEYFYYRAIALDSTHQAAIYKIVKTQLKRKQFSNAIELSNLGLETKPNNVSLLSVLGQAYSASSQYKKAIPVYEKLLGLGQESAFIYDKLGFAYYRMDDLAKAAENFKKSLEIEDRNSATHYNLGKIYNQTGDLEKAEQHLLMSILIKKQPVDAEFLSLGLTYKDQKDYKKAMEYFEKALEENPENERALLERAIAADAYFEDKRSVLSYYHSYLDKYETIGNAQMIAMAEYRISELKKEIHLSE
ncbi:tetratricopeptide repeat protein [Gramella sp. KN1008]|uniref:tetratricopeptide repeat protein n=1 Tax=Gramella sp. KN1008 TaxID=2529298 RepID=UPI00103D746D|nr:tetratricopeptide repeat protein [Gramella sp. KN1008]TBW30049.1 tetratricopeptide repeat protein [Gramella sp. KN1008]